MTSSLTISSLPQDILLLILQYLEAYDLLRLQLVSHSCREIFTDDIYLRTILRSYPNAREVRALASTPAEETASLRSAFNTVATRYYHLANGRARRLQRLNLRALDQSGQWYPTPQWDYHDSQPGGRLYHESAAAHLRGMGWKPYLFRQTLWGYDRGLIAYCPATANNRPTSESVDSRDRDGERTHADYCITVLDLETEAECQVPFNLRGKIIRNLRLKENTLIIEWAECEPFHDLNMVDKVHRHFATCYDVVVKIPDTPTVNSQQQNAEPENKTKDVPSSRPDTESQLRVRIRSEWRIHFLGLPLSNRDYFFSSHTSTHYALYYWQPNRSLWTGDEDQPIEALFVWDISSPSAYRPSEDPENIRARHHSADVSEGPRRLVTYNMGRLEWLGIRQQASISLLKFELDSQNNTVTWHENRFVSGQGYFDPAERCWESTNTTITFLGDSCVHRRVGDVEMVSYRGHCSMDSAELLGEVESWFLPVCEIEDQESKIRFGLIETCFTGMMVENRVLIRLKLEEDGEWRNLDDELVKEVGAMGKIAGDERWLIGQNSQLQLVVAKFQ